MKYELRIQDPTNPPRSPLFDEVVGISEAGSVEYLRLFFGFLTGSGMDALLGVSTVASVLRTARVDVLVGLDAVTDRKGLEFLLQLASENEHFQPRVIKNTTGALIHPKMLFARYADGSSVAVVGSNNMSFGGLNGNVEGYSIGRFESDEPVDLSDWDDFLVRWDSLITEIDDDALAAAERNENRLDRLRKVAQGTATEPDVVVSDGQAHEASPDDSGDLEEPVLVAQIPKAGDRWPQVHYSADIMERYFGVDAGEPVYLREFDSTVVEERQVVYSEKNKNYKIELAAAGDAQRAAGYPVEGRPVVVFRRESSDALRRHRYVFLMPGDDGHDAMVALSDAEFDGPANQAPRIIVARSRVIAAWPTCPL